MHYGRRAAAGDHRGRGRHAFRHRAPLQPRLRRSRERQSRRRSLVAEGWHAHRAAHAVRAAGSAARRRRRQSRRAAALSTSPRPRRATSARWSRCRSASAWSAGPRPKARRRSCRSARIRRGRRPSRCARNTRPKATSCPPGAAGPRQPARRVRDEPGLAQLPHARHEQAGRASACARATAASACIRKTLPRSFRNCHRHEGHRRQSAAALHGAGRPVLRAVVPAARRTPGSESGGEGPALHQEGAGQDGAARERRPAVAVDWTLAEQVVNGSKGVAVPVSQPAAGVEPFLASALLVENRIPAGATGTAVIGPCRSARADHRAAPVAASGTR